MLILKVSAQSGHYGLMSRPGFIMARLVWVIRFFHSISIEGHDLISDFRSLDKKILDRYAFCYGPWTQTTCRVSEPSLISCWS